MSEKCIILKFCLWLGEQGLAYETLYYGSEQDIRNLIDEFMDFQKEVQISELIQKKEQKRVMGGIR